MRRLPFFLASITWLLACGGDIFAQSTASASEGGGGKNYAFAYVVTVLSTILIMLILCMPSRKR